MGVLMLTVETFHLVAYSWTTVWPLLKTSSLLWNNITGDQYSISRPHISVFLIFWHRKDFLLNFLAFISRPSYLENSVTRAKSKHFFPTSFQPYTPATIAEWVLNSQSAGHIHNQSTTWSPSSIWMLDSQFERYWFLYPDQEQSVADSCWWLRWYSATMSFQPGSWRARKSSRSSKNLAHISIKQGWVGSSSSSSLKQQRSGLSAAILPSRSSWFRGIIPCHRGMDGGKALFGSIACNLYWTWNVSNWSKTLTIFFVWRWGSMINGSQSLKITVFSWCVKHFLDICNPKTEWGS